MTLPPYRYTTQSAQQRHKAHTWAATGRSPSLNADDCIWAAAAALAPDAQELHSERRISSRRREANFLLNFTSIQTFFCPRRAKERMFVFQMKRRLQNPPVLCDLAECFR